jgi:hypothetical protein
MGYAALPLLYSTLYYNYKLVCNGRGRGERGGGGMTNFQRRQPLSLYNSSLLRGKQSEITKWRMYRLQEKKKTREELVFYNPVMFWLKKAWIYFPKTAACWWLGGGRGGGRTYLYYSNHHNGSHCFLLMDPNPLIEWIPSSSLYQSGSYLPFFPQS